MPVSAIKIYEDSWYCLKNSLSTFLILAFCATLLDFLLKSIISPYLEPVIISLRTQDLRIEVLSTYTDEQLASLQYLFIKYLIYILPPIIISYCLLVCGTLAIVKNLTEQGRTTFKTIMAKGFIHFPNVLLLLVIVSVFSIAGGLFLILPGIIFFYGFILAPIILITDSASILQSFKCSLQLMFKHLWLFAFCLLILIAQIMLSQLLFNLFGEHYVVLLVSWTINNLVIIFFLIYLLRFYLLLNQSVTN